MPYAVTVRFDLKPGTMEAFLPLMRENAACSVRDEPGCLQFDICTDAQQPDQVFLYEIYVDRDAFDAHMQMPHYAAFGAAAGDLIADKSVASFERVDRNPA